MNDEPIPAPKWAKLGRQGSLEDPLIDEGYSYRPPTPVKLKAGWNKILIRIPRDQMQFFETMEKLRRDPYPRDKWMFTAVLVSYDNGRVTEIDGIEYATEPK